MLTEILGSGRLDGGGPAHCVFDDFEDIGIVIRWKHLMPRPEINNAAEAARPGAAAAEDFAAAEAADQEGAFGFGNIEEFAVHFLAGDD